jgi:PIN domain nuclease of toxin-antitoxin system
LSCIESALEKRSLACSDVSFWEIAMLFAGRRLVKPVAPAQFMHDIVSAMKLTVLPIEPEIAELSQSDRFPHRDPADRLIAATALHHRAPLVTSDRQLRALDILDTIW